MIRVAVIGDSHFSERSRFEECIRVHDFIAEQVRERRVDLVVHTGDVFDAKSTPEERRAVVRWVRAIAESCPVLVVRGNHDAIGDLPILEKLRTAHQVVVQERAGIHTFDTRAGRAVVGALAWPQTAHIASHLGHVSLEASGLAAGDALRAVVRGLGEQMAAFDCPRLFAAHAMVRGSRTSTGQPLVGCDLEVGLDDLALARADAVALGHIHMPQAWELPAVGRVEHLDEAAPVIYPGSPRRTAFGEVEEKAFVVLTLGERNERGHMPVSVERVATPCAPMVLLEGRWADGDVTLDTCPSVVGAEVRLRYTVPADVRDTARRAAERLRDGLIGLGAVHVKVEEEVAASVRARAPEIATARTVEEKLRAMYATQAVEPERVESLVALARSLEAA